MGFNGFPSVSRIHYGPADKNVPVKKSRLGSIENFRNLPKEIGLIRWYKIRDGKMRNNAILGCNWYKKRGFGNAAAQVIQILFVTCRVYFVVLVHK